MTIFEKMLNTCGSAAQETLIDALINWGMANDRDDAMRQIHEHPGEDLAGITNSVFAGLKALADKLGVDVEDLVSEKLDVLGLATPMQVIKACNAIHVKWIEDNFTARRWAEKFFKGQLPQYRKTSKLPWREVLSDLFFIRRYLEKGGNWYGEEELKDAFELYEVVESKDDDQADIIVKAMTFAPEIQKWIIAYRDKLDPEKKQSQISEIDEFLAKGYDGSEIMEIMIAACLGK